MSLVTANSGTVPNNGASVLVPLYVDLNGAADSGVDAAHSTNVIPATTTSQMLLLFNSDNGVQRIVSTSGSPVENALLFDGTNVQISSYGSGRAVLSGFQLYTSGWSVQSGNVYKQTLNPPLDGGGRDIVGCVVNQNDTTESPQGTVLTWVDARTVTFPPTGSPTVNNIPTNSSCYDYTAHIMYVNLGGTSPNTVTLGISGVSRFLTVSAGKAPTNFIINGLRVIGFARSAINLVQGSNNGHVYNNQLYGQGYMFVTSEYFGSGITMSQQASNIEIDHNLIEQTGDSPITPQHFGSSTGGNINNIYIHDNTISKWGLSAVEMSDFGSSNATSNINIYHNTMLGGAQGYSGNGHEVFTDGPHLRGANGSWTNIIIQSNVIQTTHGTGGCVAFRGGTSTNQCIVDNNRLSSAPNGYFNGVPTTVHAVVTNNLTCACTTDLNPASPGAGNVYSGNTTQGGPCIT